MMAKILLKIISSTFKHYKYQYYSFSPKKYDINQINIQL